VRQLLCNNLSGGHRVLIGTPAARPSLVFQLPRHLQGYVISGPARVLGGLPQRWLGRG
jgi:hypothetical protein